MVTSATRWATGRLATPAAWIRLATTIRRFVLGLCSTHAPTTSDSRFGAHTAATKSPTSAGLAWSIVTAIKGSASSEMRSPNVDIASPVQ